MRLRRLLRKLHEIHQIKSMQNAKSFCAHDGEAWAMKRMTNVPETSISKWFNRI